MQVWMMTPRAQFRDTPVSQIEMDANIAVRAYSMLAQSGIATIGEIDELTDRELSCIPCIGQKTIKGVRAAINDARVIFHATGVTP